VIVKTEFASVEENDGLIWKALERRAYELYELDGFKDGSDQEHWFRAEKELTIQDVTCSLENDLVLRPRKRVPIVAEGLTRLFAGESPVDGDLVAVHSAVPSF
jgi:DUF2934 family protein